MEVENQEEETKSFLIEPRPGIGRWASAIRLIDPSTLKTTSLIQLQQNEAAFK
jgi:hypothetical protein